MVKCDSKLSDGLLALEDRDDLGEHRASEPEINDWLDRHLDDEWLLIVTNKVAVTRKETNKKEERKKSFHEVRAGG